LQAVANPLGELAFDADIRAVVALHLEEHHLDEHLRLGRVEIGDDVADLQARFLVGDDHEVVRLRVHRDGRAAHEPLLL